MAKATAEAASNFEEGVGQAVKPYSGKNIGDYRLFRDKRELAKRGNFGNARQARNVIFPGEVVLADAPNRNFTYYWYCPFGNDRGSIEAELEGLLDEGWEQVKPVEIGGKWNVTTRFRRSPEGFPTWAGHVLYALPAEVIDKREQEARERANPKGAIKASLGSFARDSRELGGGNVQPFIELNGEKTNL